MLNQFGAWLTVQVGQDHSAQDAEKSSVDTVTPDDRSETDQFLTADDEFQEMYKKQILQSSTKSTVTITNREGVDATYDAYLSPFSDIRVVCQQPCKVPEQLLMAQLVGAQLALDKLLDVTQLDVLDSLKPVDIHVSSDHECGDYETRKAEDGYVYLFAGTRTDERGGGSYMCLWDFERENLTIPFNEMTASKIERQVGFVHEYTHILFYDRSFHSPEDFAKGLSFYVSGLGHGADSYEAQERGLPFYSEPVTTACDPDLEAWAPDLYSLCMKCGFDFRDTAKVLMRINELYVNGEGEEVEGRVSIPQFRAILEEIVGKDVVNECGAKTFADMGNLKNPVDPDSFIGDVASELLTASAELATVYSQGAKEYGPLVPMHRWHGR